MSRAKQLERDRQRQVKIRRYLVAAALAAVGGVLLWRAFGGGGPLYYFGSAVFIGMAYAAASGARQG